MANIVIVGATSAIAQATARSLCEKKPSFLLVGRNRERLDQLAEDLRQFLVVRLVEAGGKRHGLSGIRATRIPREVLPEGREVRNRVHPGISVPLTRRGAGPPRVSRPNRAARVVEQGSHRVYRKVDLPIGKLLPGINISS